MQAVYYRDDDGSEPVNNFIETVARQVLNDYKPWEDTWLREHIFAKPERAKERTVVLLEHEVEASVCPSLQTNG